MADIEKVKRNIGRMIDGGATEPEINQYLKIEGVSPDELKSPAPQGGVSDSVPFSEIPTRMAENFMPSAAKFGSDVVQPFLHPVDTAKAIYSIISEPEARAAVGQFFADRYGGWENVKRTMATDPVGFVADVSTIMTGGGALAARAPGIAGKIGKVVAQAGRNADPLTVASDAAGAVGKVAKPVASNVLGMTTGAGGAAIREAGKAGLAGGDAARVFVDNMRGNVPVEDVVQMARQAVGNMRQERSQAYRRGMANVSKDATVLDFAPVDQAFQDAANIKSFKGVDLSESTKGVRAEIKTLLDKWKGLDPAEYHTVEGFDALKQALGDIRESAPYGTPARKLADDVYNSVKGQVVKQAPAYAQVMKDYERASDLLKEVEKDLMGGQRARVDQSLRKLQTIMRNNANTNYGRRAELAENLVDSGAENLKPALAGQAVNTYVPRGLQNLTTTGALYGGMSMIDPSLIGAAVTGSPRLMGEAAYGAGRMARALTSPAVAEMAPRAGMGSFQSGRLAANEEGRRQELARLLGR